MRRRHHAEMMFRCRFLFSSISLILAFFDDWFTTLPLFSLILRSWPVNIIIYFWRDIFILIILHYWSLAGRCHTYLPPHYAAMTFIGPHTLLFSLTVTYFGRYFWIWWLTAHILLDATTIIMPALAIPLRWGRRQGRRYAATMASLSILFHFADDTLALYYWYGQPRHARYYFHAIIISEIILI